MGKVTLEDLAAEELQRMKGSPTSRTPAQRARTLSNELLAALETVKNPPKPQTPSVLLVLVGCLCHTVTMAAKKRAVAVQDTSRMLSFRLSSEEYAHVEDALDRLGRRIGVPIPKSAYFRAAVLEKLRKDGVLR